MTLALLAAAFWLLLHPYQGLTGDAALNALAVLAESGEPALAGDAYLLAGGHDPWSAAGPAFGPASAALGIELSARVASLASSLLWLTAFYLLARQCLPAERAMLALALAVTLGAMVSPYVLADYLGNGLSARLPAGALVLIGLTMHLRNRQPPAAAALVLATWLHPLIGASGLLTWWGARWSPLRVLGVGAGLVATLLLVGLLQAESLSAAPSLTGEQWTHWVRSRESSRFMGAWGGPTWWCVAAALVPTWILSFGLDSAAAGRLLRSAVACGLLGVAATGLGAWAAPDGLIFRVEASRWLWLPQALLGVAAAGCLFALIRRGPASGNPVWLALAGGLLPGWAGLTLLCAALLLWLQRSRCPENVHSLLRLPCMAIFGLCGLLWVGDALQVTEWGGFPGSGAGATGLVVIGWWAARQPLLAAPSVAAGLCLLAAALWTAGPKLSTPEFATTEAAILAEWHEVIPAEAEVLWPERPEASWFVLERKSYLSRLQSRAVVQSPDAASLLAERAQELVGTLPPAILFSNSPITVLFKMSPLTLRLACQNSGADFVVSETELGPVPAAAPLTLDWSHGQRRITAYLYDCREVRSSSSLAPDAR